jgi:WD40 repeat protein
VHLEPFAGAESLIELARREINELTETADADLAMEVMGLLTAAAGPLSVQDLADLTSDVAVPLTGRRRQILHLLTRKTARSLESVGSGENQRYQFAHYSLLEYAQESQDLSDPEYRDRIHRWAEHWRHAGWPITADLRTNTPRYLLEGYPTSLAGDPDRLAALVGEVSWIDAVVRIIGVDHALAVLRTAAKGVQSDSVVTTMLDSVVRQARHLRSPRPIHQPGYVLRQLGLQAMELGDESVAEDARARLVAAKAPGLVPKWTTRRTNLSLVSDLGVHEGGVHGLGVLPDGRVVTGGGPARRMLLWDPTTPGSSPVEFTNILHLTVWEVDVLPDGRVVTAGLDGRMLLWDPARPDCDPVELGTHVDSGLGQLGVLPDGRVITSGFEARVLLWDPATPGADPIELGIHRGSGLGQLGVLSNGRVVTHGNDGRILLWDPATPGAEPVELAVHGTSSAAVVMLNDRRMVHTQPDGRVQVWNLASSGAEPEELKSHRGKVEVQPDGRVLLWDSTTPESAPVHLGIRRAGLGQVHVLADGRVVTGGISEPVLLWDPTKPGATPVELGGEDLQGYGVKSLSHGRLVTKSNHGQLRLCAPSRDGADPVDLGMCGGGSSFSAALLEDGRLVTGEQDGRIRIWDPTTPKLEETEMDAHGGTLRSVAGLPDGRVVTGGNNGKVLLWDPKTPGADPVELGAQNGAVLAVGAIRDGRVVTGGNCRKVLLWNPATPGADPVELGTQTRGVWHLDVMADGRFVTGGFEGEVLLWDPNTPEEEPVQLGVHGKRVVAVAALADGRVVSGGTDGRVLIWDPASPGHEPITLGNVGDLMEKSPDGKTDDHCESIVVLAALADGRVVSGGTDGTLLVWDLTTSDADPFELGIHTGRVVALAELTDGWVMSSTQDGPMVLWDPKSGERIAEIAASVEALSLSSSPGESADHLTVAHSGGGLSGWSIAWRTAD